MPALRAVQSNDYDAYLKTMHLPKAALFTTTADLWPAYLESFTDLTERQHYNCHACKNFITRYGGMVTIDPVTGKTTSAVWEPENAPSECAEAVTMMKALAESAAVDGIFVSSETMLGTPVTRQWTHYATKNPKVYTKALLTAGQVMAERKEDFRTVSRAISEFKLERLEQVVELLQGDALYRSEKVLGQAEWLLILKKQLSTTRHQQKRKNIIWKAVSDAPTGFCHPRSSMIGTLLDDLDSGSSFDAAARRFKDKMHPLQYQRPSAPPTDGAILAAEKMVKALGVAHSLERRFATLADIQTIWTPAQAALKDEGAGVFDHLKKGTPPAVASTVAKITWLKFAETVLPKAKRVEVLLPSGRSEYTVYATAQHEDAPLIFQWDNPVSWYHWHGGSTATEFGLLSGWVEVLAVCLPPYMWGERNMTHYKSAVSFILRGAKESRSNGNALFPETLKSDFHAIRSVVEAHSKKSKIHDAGDAHVVGKGIGSVVRVHTNVVMQYEIDRWD